MHLKKEFLIIKTHQETLNKLPRFNGNFSCQDLYLIKNTKEIEKVYKF